MPPASYGYFTPREEDPKKLSLFKRQQEDSGLARKQSFFSPNNDQGVAGRPEMDYGSNDLQIDPSLTPYSIQSSPDLKNNQPVSSHPDEGLKPHKSIFSGLFGGGDSTPQYDKYGLQMPEKHESSLFSKILQIGLPAVTGLAGGVGVLPGLLSGYAGYKGGEGRAYANDVKNYNNAEAQAFNSDKLSQELGLKGTALGETIRHNKAEEDLTGAKITADKTEKADKQSQKDKDSADTLTYAQKASQGLRAALGKIPSAGMGLGSLYAKGVNAASLGNSQYAEPLSDIDFYSNILAGDVSKSLFSRNTQFEFQKVLKDVIASKDKSAKERTRALDNLDEFIGTKADLLNSRGAKIPSAGSQGAPQQGGAPQGATHKVMASDGKWHYTDGKNDLGVAQ